jgi:tetratricopeptide (TPR) repeat protein
MKIPDNLPRACRTLGLATALLIGIVHAPASAGGGPENVAVVVNAASWASLAVANQFVRLRHIPQANIIYLDQVPDIEQTDVDSFRERILRPAVQEIEGRGLGAQIDYLVYSADLPWRIDVTSDMKDQQFPGVTTPAASINGLTYLCGYVLNKSTAYLNLLINRYARRPQPLLDAQPVPDTRKNDYVTALNLTESKKWAEAADIFRRIIAEAPRSPELLYNLACCLARQDKPAEAMEMLQRAVDAGYLSFANLQADQDLKSLWTRDDFKQLIERMKARVFNVQPTQGFRSIYAWDAKGEVTKLDGPRYLLSTVLAVTSGRGNSVREAVEALRRSAEADGTRPTGTIYYMLNDDIRSITRQWAFAPAVSTLKDLGVKAEIAGGDIPRAKTDVQGAMIGSAEFDWPGSGSKILPGAICEHLTSFGGALSEGAGQTPLTDLIRAGAAAASGTVTEPFAIQEKFPDPFIQVHYARGCTAAEAFYQSIPGPYQLLIVGDPLCRPWAKIPTVTVSGAKAGDAVSGKVTLTPGVTGGNVVPVRHYELFIDGVRRALCKPTGNFTFDTSQLPDGYHELRIISVAEGLIETQGEVILPLRVANQNRRLTVSGPAGGHVALGEPVKLRAALDGATAIAIVQGARVLATISGAAGEATIDSRVLGLGPVELRAVGIIGDIDKGPRVISDPILLDIAPPPALPAVQPPNGALWVNGLRVSPDGGTAVAVDDTHSDGWVAKAGIKTGQGFAVSGCFEVPADEVYQFQVRTDGELSLAVDGKPLVTAKGGGWQLVPVSLAAGMHEMTARGAAGSQLHLDLRFGGPGAFAVGSPRFRHNAKG